MKTSRHSIVNRTKPISLLKQTTGRHNHTESATESAKMIRKLNGQYKVQSGLQMLRIAHGSVPHVSL